MGMDTGIGIEGGSAEGTVTGMCEPRDEKDGGDGDDYGGDNYGGDYGGDDCDDGEAENNGTDVPILPSVLASQVMARAVRDTYRMQPRQSAAGPSNRCHPHPLSAPATATERSIYAQNWLCS